MTDREYNLPFPQLKEMDIKLLIIFIVLNAVNVVIQTIKSICTIKGSKMVAALANAIAYGLYTVVVIYMVCELPLLWKVVIVGACNFVGVFIVKWIEEKARKDKLWKIEMTVYNIDAEQLHEELDRLAIPHNFIPNVGKWSIFNVYCSTQKESAEVKQIALFYNAKYFVSETKIL